MNKDYGIINTIFVTPQSVKQIEKRINDIISNYLEKNGWELDQPIELKDFIEDELGYTFELENMPEDILGCTYFESKRVVIDKKLYENLPKRANFTIAHEIAHICLHEKYYNREKEQKKLAFMPADVPSSINRESRDPSRPNAERQADWAASFILMQEKLILNYWNDIKDNYKSYLNRPVSKTDETNFKKSIVNDLTEELQVSKEALGYRIENLGLEFFGLIPQEGGLQMKLAIG